MLQITILHNSLTTAVQIFPLVDFLADLYINGESTFEIQGQGKMKTVTVHGSKCLQTFQTSNRSL